MASGMLTLIVKNCDLQSIYEYQFLQLFLKTTWQNVLDVRVQVKTVIAWQTKYKT